MEWKVKRCFAIGVQDFDRIRENHAPYIDKTMYVWQMVSTNSVNYFLSRPRRFGKSLLVDMQQIEGIRVSMDRFDAPTERISDPIPVLYQSGYITLKDYNPFTRQYTLGIPNGEVREGFAKSLYNYYLEDYVGSGDTLGNAYNDLLSKEITIEEFVETVRRWYAGIPYSITDKNQNEQLYQSLLYAALVGFGADVQAEEQTADGRMDITLKLPDTIYIIELKYGKTAEEAVEQIMKKDYAVRFAADSRPVVAIGLNISQDFHTIDDWRIIDMTTKTTRNGRFKE